MNTQTISIDEKALKVMRNDLKNSIAELSTSIISIQDKIHKALITGILITWVDKNPQGLADLLNSLTKLKGFARVESVAYYLTHVAGLHASFNKDKNLYTIKFCVSDKAKKDNSIIKSDLGVNFTYDKKHLELCKLKTNRFWLIAPVKIVELKVQDDLDLLFKGLINNAAKSIEAGTLSIDDIDKYTKGLIERIKSAQGTKRVKEFVEKFNKQHEENAEIVTATIEA